MGISNDFLNKTPVPQEITARIDKWDLIRLKSFCTAKKKLLEWRDSLDNARKSLPVTPLTGLISRIYEELKKLSTKRTNNPINKWAN
jgi:hypothetical protein